MPMLLLLGGSPDALDVGTVDGATPVTGPYYLGTPTGGVFDLMSVDGATPVAGISCRNVGVAPGPFVPNMYVELWSAAGAFISALETQTGVSFQDTLNDTGSGTLTIQLDDTDAALLVPGTEMRCYLFGEVVFTWEVLQHPRIRRWDEGEEAQQTKQVSGQGRPALLDRAKVYPPNGLTNPINPQHRIYSFASVDFPNGATWGPSVEVVRSGTLYPLRAVPIEYTTVVSGDEVVVETVWVPAPNGWPIPDAYWIWGQLDTSPVGKCYFRKTFFIGSEINVAIIASADNYFTLYMDGTPIVGESELLHNWKDYKRVDMTIGAGWHTFGAIGVNAPWPAIYDNPAAFVAAVAQIDPDGEVIAPAIIQTDSSWTTLAYPAVEPGWTPGQIMIDAISEAQARGSLAGFTYDFTATNDSLGNPWPFVPGFSTAIGSSLLDMLKGLVEQGWIDWRVKPGGKMLQMFNQGAIATETGPTYQVTGSLATQEVISQDFVPQVDIRNRYLVKWTGGYFEVEDLASQALWGEFEGFMSVDAPTLADAESQAAVVLAENATPIYAVVVELDPLDQDRFPYEAFGPGEKVRVLGPDGVLTWYQVQSISIGQTDFARPTVVLELNARLNTRQREEFELLAGLGKGISGDTKYRLQRMSFNDGKRSL